MTARRRDSENDVAFVIDGNEIISATPHGELILEDIGRVDGSDWDALLRGFATRFPGLPSSAAGAQAMAPATLGARDTDDKATLDLEDLHGRLRLSLHDPRPAAMVERHLRVRHRDQLDAVETITNLFPYPVWLRSTPDAVDWANQAYFDLIDRVAADKTGAGPSQIATVLQAGDRTHTGRVMVEDGAEHQARWFDVTKTRLENGTTFGFAIGIDAVIEAEIAQRKFVQTLTKTFAQLSTGLAIFDRERQLALFNPALVDLLELPADFLSSRPTLLTFFDKLRDNRMMPEPKDYANWRQQITELVIASVDGRYQETWTLPSGLTYRVTGRPHPDGAIALLFEDISAEVSLTRRFRWQINLGQSVIDTLDEAIAVFASSGALTLSNRAFRKLWLIDPDTSFAEFTIRDALQQWTALSAPGPFWTKLRDYMSNPEDRSEWFSDVEMKNGTGLECRIAPLAGGATLVGFRLRPVLEPAAG